MRSTKITDSEYDNQDLAETANLAAIIRRKALLVALGQPLAASVFMPHLSDLRAHINFL